MISRCEYMKEWKKKNKQKVSEGNKRYYIKIKSNTDRLEKTKEYRRNYWKKNGYKYSSSHYGIRFKVLVRDKFMCQYCGSTASNSILHVDHIVPRSMGGKTIIENLITACEMCNIGKSDLLIKGNN